MNLQNRFESGLATLCAIPCALMVVLTFIDVVGRYVLSAPLRGSLELIEFCMALVIFTALPLVTRSGGHVTVGIFEGRGSPLARRLLSLVCDGLGALALGIMCWRLWVHADAARETGARTMVLGLPEAYLGYSMALLAGLSGLILVAALFTPPKGSPA